MTGGNLFIFNFDSKHMVKIFKNISDKKGILYLLFKIGLFLLIFYCLDLMIGNVFARYYKKQNSGWEYRTRYAVEETNASILIFGASRAQQQYNPVYIEERLHQSSYNVGRDGEPIFYYYGVLKGILKRYTPSMIILDIENGVFAEAQSSYDRLSILLPFYKTHPEMRTLIEMRSPFEKYKMLSNIYPYNSLLFKIANGNSANNTKKFEDIKGYLPLTNSLTDPIHQVDVSKGYAIDSNKINCYQSFIDDCKKNKIKLYIACSPYYINLNGVDTSLLLAKKIANEKGIRFFDFSTDESFKRNAQLFDDTVHVNIFGAKIFTNQLIDSIQLQEKK